MQSLKYLCVLAVGFIGGIYSSPLILDPEPSEPHTEIISYVSDPSENFIKDEKIKLYGMLLYMRMAEIDYDKADNTQKKTMIDFIRERNKDFDEKIRKNEDAMKKGWDNLTDDQKKEITDELQKRNDESFKEWQETVIDSDDPLTTKKGGL